VGPTGGTLIFIRAIGNRRTSPSAFSQATKMYTWIWRSAFAPLASI
jgi:hypothetical protein